MKNLVRYFVAGVLFSLGVLALPILAAQLTPFTGPAGSNPAAFPSDIPDVNTVINAVNQNAAFAGTGTPFNVLGTVLTQTQNGLLGPGNLSTTILQFVASSSFTTATGSRTCVGTSGCLGILDFNGVLRWIGFN